MSLASLFLQFVPLLLCSGSTPRAHVHPSSLASVTLVSVCCAVEVAPMHQQTDVRNVHVYENQRWNPLTGYTDK